MKLVKCDFCKKDMEATEDNVCAGDKNGPTAWICDACNDRSESAYQASCMDVDFHQSQLAEMEY